MSGRCQDDDTAADASAVATRSTAPSPRISAPTGDLSRRRWCPRTYGPSSPCEPAARVCWRAAPASPRRSGASTPRSTCGGGRRDGDELSAGDTVLELTGPLRPILTAERTALNFLGRLSGIATLTAQYVPPPTRATRRWRCSTPARRRRACACSRRRPCGPVVAPATASASPTPCWSRTTTSPGRASPMPCAGPAALWPGRMVEIECDALDQVAEAARAGADAVLLDNMDPGRSSRPLRWRTSTRPGPHPHRGVRRGHAGHHRRLRGGRAGPDLGRRADALGPGARPRARPPLDDGRPVERRAEGR